MHLPHAAPPFLLLNDDLLRGAMRGAFGPKLSLWTGLVDTQTKPLAAEVCASF
jgi:hypothetical protein